MTTEQQNKITELAKEFAAPFKDSIGPIAGSGWLIADPLSGWLNFAGYEHKLQEIPAIKEHPQVMVLAFDGAMFIPAGSDLKYVMPHAHDWMWIEDDE